MRNTISKLFRLFPPRKSSDNTPLQIKKVHTHPCHRRSQNIPHHQITFPVPLWKLCTIFRGRQTIRSLPPPSSEWIPHNQHRGSARGRHTTHSPPEKRCASTELESMPFSLPFSQLLFMVHTTALVLRTTASTNKQVKRGQNEGWEKIRRGSEARYAMAKWAFFLDLLYPLSRRAKNTCFLLTFYLPFKENCNLSPPSTSPPLPPSRPPPPPIMQKELGGLTPCSERWWLL